MNIEARNEKDDAQFLRSVARPQLVLYAKSPPDNTYGLVMDSEPSSLALLAAGVAGMAARRARRSDRMKSLESHKKET